MKKLIFISMLLLSIQSQANFLTSVKSAFGYKPSPESIANDLTDAVLESNADKVYDIIESNDIKDKALLQKCLNLSETAFRNNGHKLKGFKQIIFGLFVPGIIIYATRQAFDSLKIDTLLGESFKAIKMHKIGKDICRNKPLQQANEYFLGILSWYLIWNGIKIFRKQGKIDEMLAIKSFLQAKLNSLS